MIPLALLLPVIEQALRLANTMLEGTPVEQRRAQATVWFRFWWPVSKMVLKKSGMTDQEIDALEAAAMTPANPPASTPPK